jgi:hypothetical protein
VHIVSTILASAWALPGGLTTPSDSAELESRDTERVVPLGTLRGTAERFGGYTMPFSMEGPQGTTSFTLLSAMSSFGTTKQVISSYCMS